MAMQPDRPQTIGGVLDTAIQLYKASVVKVWPVTLLIAIMSSLPSLYMMTAGANPDDPFATMAMMTNPTYWMVLAFTMILSLWLNAALYMGVHSIGMGEPVAAGAALKRAIGRTLPAVLMMILFMIAVLIGSVLLLVPGLILTVSLLLGMNLLVLEGKGPIDSLKGSHALVWGNWWRTTAILTIGLVIIVVAAMAFGIIMGLAAGFNAVAGGQDAFMAAMIIGLVTNAVMYFLMMPFYIALIIAVYWDLKLRKEGGDLAARVGALNPA